MNDTAIESYARASSREQLNRYRKVQAEIGALERTEPVLGAPWKNRDTMYEQMFSETPGKPVADGMTGR